MEILDRLSAWFDPTARWVADLRLSLEFNFDTHSLCGIRIGSSIEGVKKLGRAEDWRAARKGLFCYYSKGLEIETDAAIITAYMLVFNLSPWVSLRHQPFRGVCRLNGEPTVLNANTHEDKIVQFFGQPYAREAEEEEILLFYERGGVEWQIELSPQRQLRAIIVLNSPLMADSEQRQLYGVTKPWPPER